MKAWFRGLAAAFHTAAPAQTLAGLSLLLLTLYTGYTIPQPSMIGALKWISYISVCPLQPPQKKSLIRARLCIAVEVWLRRPHGQRIPYDIRRVRYLRAQWSRLRWSSLDQQPSVHYRWKRLGPTRRGREQLRPTELRLPIQPSLEGMLILHVWSCRDRR